jgi:formylglycine-generating enzyme required for sulfatase activity
MVIGDIKMPRANQEKSFDDGGDYPFGYERNHARRLSQSASINDSQEVTIQQPKRTSLNQKRKHLANYTIINEANSDSEIKHLRVFLAIAVLLSASGLLAYQYHTRPVEIARLLPLAGKANFDTAPDTKAVEAPHAAAAIDESKPPSPKNATPTQAVLPTAETRTLDRTNSDSIPSSPVDGVMKRIYRLDDEFSRLKIELNDLKTAEETLRQQTSTAIAWAKTIARGQMNLRASKSELSDLHIPLVFVPSGQFVMGQTEIQRLNSASTSSAAHFDFSFPSHSVNVEMGYFIGVYEITLGQIEDFVRDRNQAIRKDLDRNHPVSNIDWTTATEFCHWLSEINGIQVRLPTEVEWEYAARGNLQIQRFESAQELNVLVGGPWTVDNPVLDRSWCGCVAMNSNLQEWTIDTWDDKAYSKRAATLESESPGSKYVYKGFTPSSTNSSVEPRAVRGSSFQDIPANRVLAIRRFKPISASEETLGFRIVVPIAGNP